MVGLAVLLGPLGAQTVAPPRPAAEEKAPTQMEAFTVTGSNIRRVDEEKTLPVTIITTDDLDLRAASTPAEILDTLSIGGPIVLDEGNTLGADARGDNVSINLRGIGSGNTLILLNGRRLPPHPISQAESGVPSLAANVNQLPAAAMARMEVLRDGASAIYGTDAAAGVVNSITRSNFDGLALRARGMVTEHGGGNEWNFEVTEGRNLTGGRGNVLVTLDFLHRDTLGAWQRNYSKNGDIRVTRNLPPPFNGLPVPLPNGGVIPIATANGQNAFDNRLSDDSSNFGNFVRGNYDAGGTFVGARPANNLGIVTASGSNNMTTSAAGVFYLIPLADGTTGFRQTLPLHNLDDNTQGWYYNVNRFRPILPQTD
ncbi:MAG TPA: TonB-dependent receptor plug domain-containing protein, partial [Opitutaceae bacterium]|nr:TonB-dependent receptor plug domain-containing protein [Opitutaceae bacterium]